MRKNVIALMLILPLLFVLVVFSSVKTVSLGVPVSASGIEILGAPESGYRIDLATYRGECAVRAKVLPEGASNREYVCKTEEGSGVTVDADGTIRAEKTGESRVTVVSKDGGFEDSVKVFVYSSRPYDLGFALFSRSENLLRETEEGYAGTFSVGSYDYSAKAIPDGSLETPRIEVKEGFAIFDRAAKTAMFPFGGRTVVSVSLDGQLGGEAVTVEKTAVFDLLPLRTRSGYTVNGGNPALVADRESGSVSFFAESERYPALKPDSRIARSEVETLGEGKYRVTVYFSEERNDFSLFLVGGDEPEEVTVSFEDFDFSLRSSLPVQSGEASVIAGSPVEFYAVPATPAENIRYEWRVKEGAARLEPNADGSVCVVTADGTGAFVLEARAFRGETQLDLFAKELPVRAVRRVRTIQFAERTEVGLAGLRAFGGGVMKEGKAEPNEPVLRLRAFAEEELEGLDDLSFVSSDESVATVSPAEDGVKLTIKGRGKATVTAEWLGNSSFGADVRTSVSFFADKDAVEAEDSPSLYRAAADGRKIVLKKDILLGTDESGAPLPEQTREEMLGKTVSTFNAAFYENTGKSAEIKYALEFKNDVYGNGYSLNAELFTNAKDGAGQPLWFRGPLDFVALGELASVAAQDNAAYLVRTDGITLFNVTLLGCGDEALSDGKGGYDLSALNNVGTVLELNASAKLLNCRLRNGRTVVRAYGGNRAGGDYFLETLSENDPEKTARERISVRIEGCHLSQGREFLLKIGANRALRASGANGVEPDLLDESGKPYPAGNFPRDGYFYDNYVLTDVLVKDSVFERSGFFCVGAESNFSGELLSGESGSLQFQDWAGVGGTSFASVLRLEGDVRLYDWKELSLVDSSTLIATELPELKLDVAAMLKYVAAKDPERYGGLLAEEDGKTYVHGGIAFYGGGKNYAQFADGAETGLSEYSVNISVLDGAEGNTGYQGKILPSAAGTQDFKFYLYEAQGERGLERQREDFAAGVKYDGISPLVPD